MSFQDTLFFFKEDIKFLRPYRNFMAYSIFIIKSSIFLGTQRQGGEKQTTLSLKCFKKSGANKTLQVKAIETIPTVRKYHL